MPDGITWVGSKDDVAVVATVRNEELLMDAANVARSLQERGLILALKKA